MPTSDNDDEGDDDPSIMPESSDTLPGATETVFVEDATPSDDEDGEQVVGLEAGEAAALARKKRKIPKPIECCITLNRYFSACVL